MNKFKIANIVIICIVVIGFAIIIEQYFKLNKEHNELITQNRVLHKELEELQEDSEIHKLIENIDNDIVRQFIIEYDISLSEAETIISYSKELESKNEEITVEKLKDHIWIENNSN